LSPLDSSNLPEKLGIMLSTLSLKGLDFFVCWHIDSIFSAGTSVASSPPASGASPLPAHREQFLCRHIGSIFSACTSIASSLPVQGLEGLLENIVRCNISLTMLSNRFFPLSEQFCFLRRTEPAYWLSIFGNDGVNWPVQPLVEIALDPALPELTCQNIFDHCACLGCFD